MSDKRRRRNSENFAARIINATQLKPARRACFSRYTCYIIQTARAEKQTDNAKLNLSRARDVSLTRVVVVVAPAAVLIKRDKQNGRVFGVSWRDKGAEGRGERFLNDARAREREWVREGDI